MIKKLLSIFFLSLILSSNAIAKNTKLVNFPNVEKVHFFGYYIGNYPNLSKVKINLLLNILNKINI